MNLVLDSAAQKQITDRVKSGKYPSAEAVIAAALGALEHDEHAGEFSPGSGTY